VNLQSIEYSRSSGVTDFAKILLSEFGEHRTLFFLLAGAESCRTSVIGKHLHAEAVYTVIGSYDPIFGNNKKKGRKTVWNSIHLLQGAKPFSCKVQNYASKAYGNQ
jgi:hypothetical protein